LGSVCEAACNVHLLCSSFVPRILDGGIECELYSDIALLDICPANNSKASVHIGLSYRERDALVEVYGQCFIEFSPCGGAINSNKIMAQVWHLSPPACTTNETIECRCLRTRVDERAQNHTVERKSYGRPQDHTDGQK